MAMTANQRAAALLEMKQGAIQNRLVRAGVFNERGDQITDFQPRGLDSLDFTSLNRQALQRLLQAAYDAGFENGARYG